MKIVLYKDIWAVVINQDGGNLVKFLCRTDETGKNFIGFKSGQKYFYDNGVLIGNGYEIKCTLYRSPCAAIGITNAFFRGIKKEVTYRNIFPNIKYKKFMKMIENGNKPEKFVDVKKLIDYEKYFYKTYKREIQAEKKQPLSEEEKIRSQYFDSTIHSTLESDDKVVEPVIDYVQQKEMQKQQIIETQIEEILHKAKDNVENNRDMDMIER